MKWKTRTTGSERVPGLVIGKRGFSVRVYLVKPIKKLPTLDPHPLETSSSIIDKKGFKLLESPPPPPSSSKSGRVEINKKRERLTAPSDPKPNNKRSKSSSESELATQNPSQPKKTTIKITCSVSKGGLDLEKRQPKSPINQEGLSKQNQGGESESESDKALAPPPAGAPTPLRKLILAARNKLDELNAQRRNEQGEGETRKREEEANIIMKKNHLEEAETKRSTWILDRQEFKLKVQEVENKAYRSPLFQDNLRIMTEFQKLISQSS